MRDPTRPIIAQLREISRVCNDAANDLSDRSYWHSEQHILIVASAMPLPEPGDGRLAEIAGQILKLRRERERLLGATLFADPAWDMLLDLFVQRHHGRKVSVSSLCIAAAVPATTALRYLVLLEARGLILRARDPRDARLRHVELTAVACDAIRRLLGKLAAMGNQP